MWASWSTQLFEWTHNAATLPSALALANKSPDGVSCTKQLCVWDTWRLKNDVDMEIHKAQMLLGSWFPLHERVKTFLQTNCGVSLPWWVTQTNFNRLYCCIPEMPLYCKMQGWTLHYYSGRCQWASWYQYEPSIQLNNCQGTTPRPSNHAPDPLQVW